MECACRRARRPAAGFASAHAPGCAAKQPRPAPLLGGRARRRRGPRWEPHPRPCRRTANALPRSYRTGRASIVRRSACPCSSTHSPRSSLRADDRRRAARCANMARSHRLCCTTDLMSDQEWTFPRFLWSARKCDRRRYVLQRHGGESHERHTGAAPLPLARRFATHHERGLRLRRSGELKEIPDRGRLPLRIAASWHLLSQPRHGAFWTGPIWHAPLVASRHVWCRSGRRLGLGDAELDTCRPASVVGPMSSEDGRTKDLDRHRAMGVVAAFFGIVYGHPREGRPGKADL